MEEFVIEEEPTIEATFQMDVNSGDHKDLDGRDLPDQHPMSAITGLETALDGKVDKTDESSKVYGTDSEGNQTTYDVGSFGQVDDVQVDGISIVENKIANLGTMALESLNDYSTTAVANTLYADKTDTYTKSEVDTALSGKQNNLTSTQLNAVNSGIDSTKVTQIDTNAENITSLQSGKADKATTLSGYGITDAYTKTEVDTALSGKQNSLDTTQMAAVNSGANATNIGQIATNTNSISSINELIPNEASSSNQLADKEFVNSSISTNTARFIGTFSSVTALEAYSGTVTNNDYAFVVNSVITDNGNDWATFAALDAYNKDLLTNFDYGWVINGSNFDLYRFDILSQTWNLRVSNTPKANVTLNTAYNRYKATVSGSVATWEWEYTLNNSSFTASQLAAINSGITSGDVALIATALQPNDNISELTNDSGYLVSSDIATGSSNGTISVNGSDVSVYGLGSAAYTASTAYDASGAASTAETNAKNYADSLASNYATAAQGAKADTALQSGDNVSELVNNAGYITGITSSDVTTALGYTPYSSANPSGYTSNVGTVTSVNNTQPDANGNVTISAGSSYTAGTGIIIQNNEISVNGKETQEIDVYIPSEASIEEILETVSGFDASKTQTLKNVNGTLMWVDD